MKVTIKKWYGETCLFEADVPEDVSQPMRVALEKAVTSDANLRGADLRDANLRGADLGGADLGDADLRGANLHGANLGGANLRDANLRGADLHDANLRGADLGGADLGDADLGDADLGDADLRGADLGGADLGGANLHDAKDGTEAEAVLSNGLRFGEFVKEVVPALLVAGGRKLEEVATEEHWNCHDWTNCPMAAAFGVDGTPKVPPVWRRHAEVFVSLFDARQIPLEAVRAKTAASASAVPEAPAPS